MGNNVAVVVHTDELDRIAKDKEYGARLVNAIEQGEDAVCGFNTQVLPYAHADYTQVILVRQNTINSNLWPGFN